MPTDVCEPKNRLNFISFITIPRHTMEPISAEGLSQDKKRAGRVFFLSPALDSYSAFTVICLGLTSSFLGQVMVKTPCLKLASILSASTTAGSLKERAKEP
jgi:hypothetical protein